MVKNPSSRVGTGSPEARVWKTIAPAASVALLSPGEADKVRPSLTRPGETAATPDDSESSDDSEVPGLANVAGEPEASASEAEPQSATAPEPSEVE